MKTKWYIKRFVFLSDAIAFQKRKRAEGWRTVKNIVAGAGWPYTEIRWQPK